MEPSTSNLMFSMKILLISIGAVSSALAIKSFVPLVLYEFPTIWTGLISWLKPPYLYVLLNGIIILIAATSLSHRQDQHSSDQSQPLISPQPQVAILRFNISEYMPEPVDEPEVFEEKTEPEVLEEKTEPDVEPEPAQVVENEKPLVSSRFGHRKPLTRSSSEAIKPLPEVETELLQQLATEKPLVSSRFGHRKPLARSSPEGVQSLRVARVKRHETLESTWKKITEGRHVPLTRHINKLDTWQNQNRGNESAVQHIKRRLEPSPSKDELNRRVESFIKKFNEEMRLQREQSLRQYKEMINRGV